MASKDFIYDLLDKLESEETAYVLMTFNDTEDDVNGEIFFNFYRADSQKIAVRLLEELTDRMKQGPLEDGQDMDITIDDEDDD